MQVLYSIQTGLWLALRSFTEIPKPSHHVLGTVQDTSAERRDKDCHVLLGPPYDAM